MKKYSDLGKNEKPSILSNTMFKTMFYNTKRLKYSVKLISYFVDISYEELFHSIKLVKNELDKEYNDTKEERSDYVCDINGSKINIEVNNNDSVDTMYRNMEYAFRLYTERVKIGKKYHNLYNQVIQINLNNYSFIGNDKVIDIFSFQNEDGIVLNDKITIIEIYVPNLRKKCYTLGKDRLSELEKYLLGLIEEDNEISLDMAKEIEIMIDYVNEAGEVTKGTNFGESYDKEWALQDQGRREGIEIGKNQGIEIGKSQGIEIGKSLIIMNLFESGMNVEEISKATKVSEEEVKEIISKKNNH